MPFGIDVDMERVKESIQSTLKEFGMTYTKAFAIALVGKVIEDATEEKEEDSPFQLAQAPPDPVPSIEGKMKRQTTVLGRWKEHEFWIEEDYTLAYGSLSNKEKPAGRINLFGYKVQGVTRKPEGARKGGPDWIPDEERPNCVLCNKAFSLTVWHHHCRACGEVFCSDCAGNKAMLKHFGYDEPARVCNPCFEKLGRSRAQTFAVADEEAKEDDTFHGIQLLHVSRTPYMLQCPDLQGKLDWIEAIKECAKNASPPINKDPVQAAAFEEAHRATSWHVGLWGRWQVTGSESEMIADIIAQVVRRDIVEPALNSAPDSVPPKVKRMASTTINKNVLSLVRASVAPGWEAILAGVTKTQDALEEKIKPLIDPIAKAKADALATLQGKIMEHVNPLLEKVGKVVLDKVFEVVSQPVQKAHQLAFEVLNTEVSRLAILSTDKPSFDTKVKEIGDQLKRRHGSMAPVHEHLSDLKKQLRKMAKEQPDVFQYLSVSATVQQVADSVQRIVDNAVFTLASHESLSGDAASEAAVKAAYKEVSAKVLHDSKLEVSNTIKELLSVAVVGPVQEKLLQNEQLGAITEPIDEMLPEAVSEFVSVGGMIEELVDGVCGEAIDTAVDSSLDGVGKNLAAVMADLSLSK